MALDAFKEKRGLFLFTIESLHVFGSKEGLIIKLIILLILIFRVLLKKDLLRELMEYC